MNTVVKKLSWWLFAIMCIMIGLYPAIYFLIEREFGLLSTKSPELLAFLPWNAAFYGHIIFGGLALLIGWLQFSKKLRNDNINLHRWVGKAYVIFVLISSLCGIYIGTYATGGVISILGFVLLGIVWFLTTVRGFLAIKNGKVDTHENYLIFSYAACFAAVTLRIWLPLLNTIFEDFFIAYRMVAWLCWVPNLVVAFWIVKSKKKLTQQL